MAVGVVVGLGHIVNHVDIQQAGGAAVVAVGRGYRERLADAVGISPSWVAIGAIQGVAVADHASGGVVVGDGQGITKTGGLRLRERRGDAVADNADTAHGEVFQTIQRGHCEGPGLGQRRTIIGTAQRQILLVDGDFAACDIETGQHYWIVVVMHLQDEIGRAGIAVGVRQRIGEGFSPVASAVQGQELRIGLVQGVGVAAIGQQVQGAVGSNDGCGCNRAGRNAVGALHIVAQHAAGQDQLAFRGHLFIAVIGRRRHIVHHADMQRASGRAVVGVIGDHAEAFAQLIGPSGQRVRLSARQGVAVADHPGARIKTGDGQGIAQSGGDRLREAGGDTAGYHTDPAHGQVL